MVSKQYTKLAMMLPVAMIIGTLISIYAYKQSQMGISIVIIVCMSLLIVLLFYVYGTSKKKSAR